MDSKSHINSWNYSLITGIDPAANAWSHVSTHTHTPHTHARTHIHIYIYMQLIIDHWIAFERVCRYLYCDDVSLEADTVLPTLYAAKKYMLPHLAKACVECLETNIDASNACLLLSQTRIYEESDLEQHCLSVIDLQTEEAIESDSFAEIDIQTLEQILTRDTLCAKETLMFAAATWWAEAECTRQGRDINPEQCREVLGLALYLLRLPTMTPNEFANGVVQSGLLSKQEIIDVFLFFNANDKPKVPFLTVCRKGPEIKTCNRFQVTGGKMWEFTVGRINSIKFSVDKAISVIGFGLYGSGKLAACPVHIALQHNDGTVLCKERHSMSDDGSSNTTQVMFSRPVRIKANTYYTASFVEGFFGLGHYGISGMAHVRCDNINFTFMNDPDGNQITKISQGQIPEILFYHWPDPWLLTYCNPIPPGSPFTNMV